MCLTSLLPIDLDEHLWVHPLLLLFSWRGRMLRYLLMDCCRCDACQLLIGRGLAYWLTATVSEERRDPIEVVHRAKKLVFKLLLFFLNDDVWEENLAHLLLLMVNFVVEWLLLTVKLVHVDDLAPSHLLSLINRASGKCLTITDVFCLDNLDKLWQFCLLGR